MIKLKDIEVELIEELREVADEFRYMSSYAKTKETARIMSELKQALIETTDSVLEHDLEQFNNNWQWLKYVLVDLENAIHEGNGADFNKLDKSLADIHNFQVWSIDRLTNQPVIN